MSLNQSLFADGRWWLQEKEHDIVCNMVLDVAK